MELLVLSHTAPFDKVGSAGEKTHNYYLKAFARHEKINVTLITICKAQNYDKLDYEDYKISNQVLVENQDKFAINKRKLLRAFHIVFDSHNKYANFVSGERLKFYKKSLERLYNQGYNPDVIILEFTHCVLLVDLVKVYFPKSKIIASSHDVNYVGSYRMWKNEKNILIKYFRKKQYNNLKIREVTALSKCDLIVPHNEKDIDTLRKEKKLNSKTFFRIVPYYDNYSNINRISDKETIIFFGDMGRPENYRSIMWFIENVFNKLELNLKFVVIGGNPPESLKKYESEKIHITGFLDKKEIDEYFSKCLCMVVPLILGSGIKVKILEAFSAGIPVVTNEIGNEGIFAKDQNEILICKNDVEFIERISQIENNIFHMEKIGKNAQEFVKRNFDLEQSKNQYIQQLFELCKEE